MAWTEADAQRLRDAIARGEMSVTFADRTVSYRSVGELIKALDVVERALATTPRQTVVVPKR